MGEVRAILDTSALIALLTAEPGADEVFAISDGAGMSTVNWTEVLDVTAALGLSTLERREQVERLGVTLIPFAPEHAEAAAALRPATRRAGLSLADRACLALALALDATAVTADRVWTKVDVDVEVKLIR